MAAAVDEDEFGYAPSPLVSQIPESPQKGAQPITGDYSKDKELVECVKRITPRCGDAVFLYVYAGEAFPSRHCCEKLVSAGRQCHERMIERIAKAVPEYRDRIISDPRNEKLWTYCLTGAGARVSSLSPSPSPSY
ncbi:hypothetical protein MLD38_040270 [Melastoma candidum]|uniref:Uncharacterized protein n=1 Tax=Melastoma candidum TaxID=119954 RepID=A0ACB9L5G6_9MYRT|nr:hypothetical protein MLD38_040270 [Melastoma candidum]